MLLVGAGLLARTFQNLRGARPRVRPAPRPRRRDGRTARQIRPQAEQRRQLYRELLERIDALPGVEARRRRPIRPLLGPDGWDWPYRGRGPVGGRRPSATRPFNLQIGRRPGSSATMGMPLRQGRTFDDRDTAGAPAVVVISEALARRTGRARTPSASASRSPMPTAPYTPTWMTVVGVVGRSRGTASCRPARLDLYMSYLQSDAGLGHLVVRTAGDPLALAAAAARGGLVRRSRA